MMLSIVLLPAASLVKNCRLKSKRFWLVERLCSCPIMGTRFVVLCLTKLLRTETALLMLQGSLDDPRERWSSHAG
jgi:hypothetical protein